MTDEKKKLEENELSDEQLDDVAGGFGLNVSDIRVSSIKEKAPTATLSGTSTGESEGDLGDAYLLSQLAQQSAQDPSKL